MDSAGSDSGDDNTDNGDTGNNGTDNDDMGNDGTDNDDAGSIRRPDTFPIVCP
jgi:hypothetical protein